jgi:hypothetical protein
MSMKKFREILPKINLATNLKLYDIHYERIFVKFSKYSVKIRISRKYKNQFSDHPNFCSTTYKLCKMSFFLIEE